MIVWENSSNYCMNYFASVYSLLRFIFFFFFIRPLILRPSPWVLRWSTVFLRKMISFETYRVFQKNWYHFVLSFLIISPILVPVIFDFNSICKNISNFEIVKRLFFSNEWRFDTRKKKLNNEFFIVFSYFRLNLSSFDRELIRIFTSFAIFW